MHSSSSGSSEHSKILNSVDAIEVTPASSVDTVNAIPNEKETLPSQANDQHGLPNNSPEDGDGDGQEPAASGEAEESSKQPPGTTLGDVVVPRTTLSQLLRDKNDYYKDSPYFDDDDKVTWITKTARAMEWLLKEAAYEPQPEHEVSKAEDVRCIAASELKLVTWKEWIKAVEPPNKPHSAIYLLTEDPPLRSRGRSLAGSALIAQLNQGAETVDPELRLTENLNIPRIMIRSLPLMRILLGLCDDKLNYNRDSGLVILRPFKILDFLEQDIRNRLEELRNALYEFGPVAKVPSAEPSTTQTGEWKASESAFTIENIFRAETDWTSLSRSEKEEAARDMECLVSFMDKYLVPLRQGVRTASQIYFNQLWYLFRPGSLIYVKDKSTPQKVWRVIQGTGGRRDLSDNPNDPSAQLLKLGASFQDRCNPFVLDCYYIDWNGTHFVRIHKTFVIEEFSDQQSISSMQIIPFDMAIKLGLISREELIERADQFLECTTPSYRYYSGRSMNLAPRGDKLHQLDENKGRITTISEFVESQVMVDFEPGLQRIPDWSPDVSDATMSATRPSELNGDLVNELIEDDRVWDVRIAERVLGLRDPSQAWEKQGDQISGEDKLLLPARVIAFVFRTRRWACLEIGRDPKDPTKQKLSSVDAKPDAWGELEILPNHRNVIESLMASHFTKTKSERRQFDFVKDKGKGVIILLHGVPGVGKTSTAETVAEYYNKPLLPITCGDLGVTPRDVERNLEDCFQMAQAWECVLLLDEADIFLAARSTQNENRNALVSVFLRVLEYYEGVLFLTTNQVGAFDEAFKSRISMALYYPPLSIDQTVAIWKSQIKRIAKNFPEVRFNGIDLEYYARELYQFQSTNEQYKPVWNGRQIRNAFQTAVSMAEFESHDKNIEVTRKHFERVAEVSNQFNLYLWRVKWLRTDEYRMRAQGLRDDSFGYESAPPAVPSGVVPVPQAYPIHAAQPGVGQPVAQFGGVTGAYPIPGMGAAVNPAQFMTNAAYNNPAQTFAGSQPVLYGGTQTQAGYPSNPTQPQYPPPNAYPNQGQGQGQIQGQIQGQVQGQVPGQGLPSQQSMAPPQNQYGYPDNPPQHPGQG